MTAPVPKRLVVCLDGTNNEIGKQLVPTNVGKTFELLQLSDARQEAYYDPGIGTLPDVGARGALDRRLSVLRGLAFGHGVTAKLAGAYTWLMNHYEHGTLTQPDPAGPPVPRCRIYVFGFSRGAFTARALVGMLNRVGLLRPGSENLVPYAVKHYAVNEQRFDDAAARDRARAFSDAFCWGTAQDPMSEPWPGMTGGQNRHAVPVSFLGVWDTVEAVGRPGGHGLRWDGVHRLANAARIRHAVSIDEWRRPFRVEPVTHPRLNPVLAGGPDTDSPVQEAWFPGVHCDVGGTYPNNSRLSTAAFSWVLDPLLRAGELTFRETDSLDLALTVPPPQPAGCPAVHDHPGWWRLAGAGRRTVPGGAWLHPSTRELLDSDARYRPRNLPADVVWLRTPAARGGADGSPPVPGVAVTAGAS